MNKQDIILELINVNKKYDDSYAVENFNLYVKKVNLSLSWDLQDVVKQQPLE